jgi:hypothetical protein
MTEQSNPETTPTTTGPAKKAFPKRTALLIGGGVLAGALLVGGGVAIGNALDDDDDRDDLALAGATQPAQGGSGSTGAPSDSGTAATVGTADAAALSDIIATASAFAASDGLGGEPTAIDAKRDGGWEVRFEAANGDETEVYVGTDGSTRIVETDPADGDDQGPTGSLDEATVASIVDAALAEADGVITDIDLDDDGRSPYDVTVLLADRSTIDIDLGPDFAVLGTDVDREDD